MEPATGNSRWWLAPALGVVLAAGAAAGYFIWFRSHLPGPNTPQYDAYVRLFQVGVARMESGFQPEVAEDRLTKAIDLVPGEPAAWADRGLLYLRNNNLPKAASDLKEAHRLAPENTAVEAMLGQLARRQGKLPEAVAHLRKVVEKDPHDLASVYALAEAISEQGGPDAQTEYQQLMERILETQPNSLHALIQRAQTAYQRKDKKAFADTLERLDRLAPNWKPDTRAELAKLEKLVAAGSRDVELQLTRFGNLLKGERGYSREARLLQGAPGQVGTPLHQFLRLQPMHAMPAPPDRELAFHVAPWAPPQPAPGLDKSRWDALFVQWRIGAEDIAGVKKAALNGGIVGPPERSFRPAVWLADGRTLQPADIDVKQQPFPGGTKNIPPSPAGVLALDWNNDLRMDLMLAGAGGLRFLQQADDQLTDVTSRTELAKEVLGDDYYGAWAADIDTDGDLDIILARRKGPPLVLRNNGDGTFKALTKRFDTVHDVRAFVWADLDNDGANDAIFLDADGALHVFANERSGQFADWPLPGDIGRFVAVTAADVNDDGVFDLVALRADGSLVRIADVEHRKKWEPPGELARITAPADKTIGAVTLLTEDLDNNGAIDIIVAGPRSAHVLLGDESFKYTELPATVEMRVCSLLDVNGDGRLDFLGLSTAGKLVVAHGTGQKDYHSRLLRPLANPVAAGDERNNSFAVGGQIQVCSGLQVQSQRITGPMVHFGLGAQKDIDVARITWPSGAAQWEFEIPESLQRVVAAQRLTGSCPFLFTYDGTGMRFVGDCMWNTPLGMYVNGQELNSFTQTTEWLKVRGEHLVPKDGYYDVRVHANLWETDYFDQLALLVVDHPADTDIHVDERFFLTPTPPKLYVTTPARPVARARDHLGADATEEVSKIDGRYLDRAGRGKYQGITADHWVEAELGDDAPTEGPVYLIARGWTHPTDGSINVAITQGKHDAPRPLVLEVPDGKGGWKVGRPALGFPAGKDKTMVVRVDGIDGPGVTRRFRLRTNMEIYWDYLGYARGLDAGLARIERPAPKSAELRYKGFLEMTQKDASSPEVPHYDKVMQGRQLWRDLTGYYTRYGDVRELVANVDDRYVIANAGDEIALKFGVPAGPQPGWRRDFIWESDGWTRDGNANTRFGTTVLPLPAHGISGLDQPPGRLADDPVVRRFPQDWQTYHTRYVGTDDFERGLRTFRVSSRLRVSGSTPPAANPQAGRHPNSE